MPNKVTIKDKGADKVLQILEEKMNVNVVIEGKEDVQKRALIHEFSERSFIRGYIDDNQNKIRKEIRKMAEIALKTKKSIKIEAQKFGGRTVIEIKRRIGSGIPPKLKPETIKQKRRKNSKAPEIPLIDTGGLRNAITFEVELLNK